jgi:hypothetical protein
MRSGRLLPASGGLPMQVIRAREFSVYLQDRPGELAGVLEAIAASGIQTSGLTVSEVNGRGLVRLLGSPEDGLRTVCEHLCDAGAGPVAEADVLVAELDGRPNGFREIAIRLAAAGINVRYAYQGAQVDGLPGRCVLRVDDMDLAQRTILDMP